VDMQLAALLAGLAQLYLRSYRPPSVIPRYAVDYLPASLPVDFR
jgi:hypothetical protein